MRDPEPINYPLLFAVILIAVTGGNLLSNWITGQLAAVAIRETARDFTDFANRQAAQSRAQMEQARRDQIIRQDQQTAQLRRQRAASPTGRKLEAQCNDWDAAYQQFKSEATQMELDKSCKRYFQYLDTGQ